MTMLDDEKKYIYFTGDFFWSENDSNDVVSLIKKSFNDGYIILNAEGSLKSTKISKITVQKKAVNLSFNKEIMNLAVLPHCFLSLVNNHASDYGKHVFEDFRKLLGRKALASFSTDRDPRRKVADINLLFFADEREECRCTEYNFLRFDKSVILKNKKYINESYIIVHGGIEYRKHPTVYQRYLAHLLIECGANAVIFHHSHITGHHEWINGKLIHYGLGNFYFSQVDNLHGLEKIDGNILRLDLRSKSFRALDPLINIKNDKVNISINATKELHKSDITDIKNYPAWYKKKYPIDSSLRPRQLYQSELIIKIQYNIWYAIASKLVQLGLTRKLKHYIKLLTKI